MIKSSPQKVKLAERSVKQATPQELKNVVNEMAVDLKKLGDAHDMNDDTLSAALRGGISSENNNNLQFKEVVVDMPADAPFEALVLESPWTGHSSYPPKILMEPGGRVTTRGAVLDGGGGAGNPFTASVAGYVSPSQNFAIPGGGSLIVSAFPPELYVEDTAAIGIVNFFIGATWICSAPRAPHVFPSPWPVIVDHGWSKCHGLTIEAHREESTGPISTSGAPVADWEDIGNGQLRLNGVWGLQWGKRFKLRLRLSAEEV